MTRHAIGSYYSAKAQYNKVIKFVFSCYTVAEEVDGVGGRRVDFWILRCPQKVLQVLYYLWVHSIYLIMHLTHKFLSTSILWVLIPPLFFFACKTKSKTLEELNQVFAIPTEVHMTSGKSHTGWGSGALYTPHGFLWTPKEVHEEFKHSAFPNGLHRESLWSPQSSQVHEDSMGTLETVFHGLLMDSPWTPKRLPPSFI